MSALTTTTIDETNTGGETKNGGERKGSPVPKEWEYSYGALQFDNRKEEIGRGTFGSVYKYCYNILP